MKTIGIIVMVVGIVVAIIGIQQTTAIHAYNMSDAAQGGVRSDILAITTGIIGCAVLVIGWVFFISKQKAKVTK